MKINSYIHKSCLKCNGELLRRIKPLNKKKAKEQVDKNKLGTNKAGCRRVIRYFVY